MKKKLTVAMAIIAALAATPTQAATQADSRLILEMTMTGSANPWAVCQQADNSTGCVRTVQRGLWQLTPSAVDALRAKSTPEALRAVRPADVARLLAYALVQTDYGKRGSIAALLNQGQEALANKTQAPWPSDLVVAFEGSGATLYEGQRVYLKLFSNN